MDNQLTHHFALTDQGKTLLLKQQMSMGEGQQLLEIPITRVLADEGYTHPAELEHLTLPDLDQIIGEMEVGPRKLLDGKVLKLPLRFSNEGLTVTRLIRRLAICCMDPDEGEILYQAVQFNSAYHVYSQAATGGAVSVFAPEIDLTFANAEAVTIQTNPGWCVSWEDLADWIADTYICDVEHDLPYPPVGALFRTESAAGTQPAGEGPAGGGQVLEVPCRLELKDSRTVGVYTTTAFKGTPEVRRVDSCRFALLFPGSTTNLILTMR